LQKTTNHFNPSTEAERLALPSVPWWFQTLLRHTGENGAYGFWHHFSTFDPAINFCSIEKVGTSEWRSLFCDLNEDECPNVNGSYPADCVSGVPNRMCHYTTNKPIPNDAPHAVFLRDPLERLLSGFLDKCVRSHQRINERHCEPNEVFHPDLNKWGDAKVSPTTDIEANPKQFFAAYLDILPLRWNLHFVPQALYCDLYRNINNYAFVGNMGKDFLADVERMANQFQGRMPAQLDKSFGYVDAVKQMQFNNTGNSDSHATHSPEKGSQYYTAASVRKALELYSIDYVTLNLEVPSWAKAMLRDETV
jgi:hypothetical protein